MGLLIGEDSSLFREYFKECSALRGIHVEYIYPVDEGVSIHGEIDPEFSSLYPMDVIFETNPTIKTLKNYGWVSEDKANKPYIAYLPYDTPHLQTKARIKIPPVGASKDGRWFEITDINEAIEFPSSYICKLAPVYTSETPKLNYSETNENYIQGDNQPDQSTHHIQHINDNLEDTIARNKQFDENKSFSYLKL